MVTSTRTVPPASLVGFILVHDTLCHGVIPAEWDVENLPVFYLTRAEAEAERMDAEEMRADALDDAQAEPDGPDDGMWVEVAVLNADGTLALPELRLTFSADALREILFPS